MRRRVWTVLAPGMLLWIGAVGPAGGDPLAAVRAELEAKWAHISALSCQASVEVQFKIPDGVVPASGSGPLVIAREAGANFMRFDIQSTLTVPVGGAFTGTIPQTFVGVFDGAQFNLLTWVLRVPFVMRSDASKDPEARKPPAQWLFGALAEDCVVRVVPDATVHGTAAHVIEAKVKKPDLGSVFPVAQYRLFCAKDSGLPLLCEAFDAAGSRIGGATFSNFDLHPAIPQGHFRFQAPEGAQALDFEQFGQVLGPGGR